MIRTLIERLFRLYAVRAAAGTYFLSRGYFYQLRGKQYRSLRDFCWVVRVANVRWLQDIARRVVFRDIDLLRRTEPNSLAESYRADPVSAALASTYAISGSGTRDLFRDVVVLKAATPTEKGVILLKYARTFSAAVALLNVRRLMDRYVFVLEPCWSGYCDPAVLMFIAPDRRVLVQCFTESDYEFIASVGSPLVPVRLGPADWVDADVFDQPHVHAKKYDLVMVANWAAHKRHALLFRALQNIRDRQIRVLLIGFAWADRTADDIRQEAARYSNDKVNIEILENVPQTELARYVSQSKVFVFLSRKEGDNKAVVESMFADVPVIVYDKTIGGAGSRVNSATGIFASDEELSEKIVYMLDHHSEFTPRAWALRHTGSAVATGILNEALRVAVQRAGDTYSVPIVEKTNAPNLAYKDAACRERFKEDYEFILSCLRDNRPRKSLEPERATA